jgi:hypothetical protein
MLVSDPAFPFSSTFLHGGSWRVRQRSNARALGVLNGHPLRQRLRPSIFLPLISVIDQIKPILIYIDA